MLTYQIYENGARVRYYSDAGKYIRQIETGALYEEAVHTAPCAYTYEETDVPLPDEANDLEAEEALRILMGGEDYDAIEGA